MPLRPLTVGELLDGAFSTLRRYPRTVLLPGVVISVAETLLVFLIQVVTNRQGSVTLGQGVRGDVAALLVTLVSTVAQILLAALVVAVVQKGILGQPVTIEQAWATIRPRAGAIVGAAILASVLSVLGLVVFVLPGVYLWVALHFTSAVLVVEGGGAGASLRRSRELVSGAWWRTFGLLLLVSIITGIVSFFVAIPFDAAAIGTVFSDSGHVGVGAQALADVGRLITGVFAGPFTAAAIALIYVDRRMRAEGLDVKLRQAAGS